MSETTNQNNTNQLRELNQNSSEFHIHQSSAPTRPCAEGSTAPETSRSFDVWVPVTEDVSWAHPKVRWTTLGKHGKTQKKNVLKPPTD